MCVPLGGDYSVSCVTMRRHCGVGNVADYQSWHEITSYRIGRYPFLDHLVPVLTGKANDGDDRNAQKFVNYEQWMADPDEVRQTNALLYLSFVTTALHHN